MGDNCFEDGRNILTGLYFENAFYKEVEEYVKEIKPCTYMFVAIDIEHFRFFNKLYGTAEGDKLLKYVAFCLEKMCKDNGGVAGYMGLDNYAVLMPNNDELLKQLKSDIAQGVRKLNNAAGFLPAFGVFVVDDITMTAAAMYERATIALSYVFGNYANRVCYFSDDMISKIEEELVLLAEIQEGLDKEEFTFFVQPQCDISTGKIVGGESLVRWKHGEKGLVPPGVFIPVLEKNGFIADLDKYVWEKVCQWLRDWMNRGYKPVPISLNVSRIDIFTMDVVAYLKELLDKYEIPPKFLKVEITESAYAESDDKIIRTVKQLRDSSFLVMMDDFGSGYSSLNMLKSVSVDVLKIDMCFLDIDENEEEKGIGILESVVNMARQMKIPIIVEGVETKKQEDFLLKMGCRYMQGYFYYRPLPIDKFEELISDERNVDYEGIWCKQVEQMHVREFLDTNLFNDTMVNNIIGPSAFYEMYDNKIEITRVNEEYYKLAGIKSGKEADSYKKFWNHVRDDDRQLLFSIFEQAYSNPANGAEGYIHYVRIDGEVLWVHIKVFFLRVRDNRKIFYSSLRDVSFLQEKKHEESLATYSVEELSDEKIRRMEKYYGALPCGYSIGRVFTDEDDRPYNYEILYANKEMSRISGGDIGRLRYLGQRAFEASKAEMLQKAYRAAYFGEVLDYYVYSSISCRYLQFTFSQYEYGYTCCMMRDVTHTHIYEDALKNILYAYEEVYFVHLQDNYCRMLYPDENHLLERGNYEEVINRHFAMGKIARYDEENVRRFLSIDHLKVHLSTKDVAEYKYKRCTDGVREEWCQATFTISERVDKVPKIAILTIRSIETLMRENEEYRHQAMAKALSSMSDGFFIYDAMGDEEILYANPTVLKIFGCSTMAEFKEYIGNSFRGMVYKDDLGRVETEIAEQIKNSERKMDYIKYRIMRKDGELRWLDDCGHLEDSGECGEGCRQFYVFISDITDTITEREKNKLITQSSHYNTIWRENLS